MDYQEAFQEGFDLVEEMKTYSGNMPNDLKNAIDIFLKKYSEEIYGIKDYLNE